MALPSKAASTDVSTENDEGRFKKTMGFLGWIQEFTKKVVSITFVIFILSNIFCLVMIWLQYRTSYEITYIDTFITETHQTFRDVIGGYLIKAAAENVIKIGGGYMESYVSTKTTIIEQQHMMAAGGAAVREPVVEDPSDDSEDPQNPSHEDVTQDEVVNG